MAVGDYAINQAAAAGSQALDTQPTQATPEEVAAALAAQQSGLAGGQPTQATQQAVAATGQTPTALNAPSDSFTPSTDGDFGQVASIPRDQEKKKQAYDGMSPLFDEGDAYAVILLVPDSGTQGAVETFEDFLLTSVTSPNIERQQIYRNFGAPIFYFSGKDVEIFTYSGSLLTGRSSDGSVPLDHFVSFYRDRLRGTMAVANGYQAYVAYNGWIVSGYVSNLQTAEDANDPTRASFTFQLSVTKIKLLNANATGG